VQKYGGLNYGTHCENHCLLLVQSYLRLLEVGSLKRTN
jgi:hypothetical protein